jgi:hypothetical protein
MSFDVGMLIKSSMRGVSLVVALYLDGSVEVPISSGNVIRDMELTQLVSLYVCVHREIVRVISQCMPTFL